MVNVIRFYEALPLLRFGDTLENEEIAFLRGQSWECALCLDSQAATAVDWQGVAPWMGVSIPTSDLTRTEELWSEPAASIFEAVSAMQASFLTCGDLPREVELKYLTKALAAIRGRLEAAE